MARRIGVYTWYAPAPGGGERYVFGAAEALAALGEVDLLCPRAFDPLEVGRSLGLDLSRMRMVPHPWRRLHGVRDWLARGRYDLFFALSNHLAPFQLSLGRRGILHLQCPPYPPPFHTPRRSRMKLRTYDRIVVNSRFTETWARRHGTEGLPIDVVYPPIDVDRFRPGAKKPWILSVGRFFVGRHEKRQDVLVDAFRRLRERGLEGWELHLVGGLRDFNREDVAFLDRLREESRGLPVSFHVNAPLEEVLALNASASIYWHAAGYDVDVDATPQFVEHFGMTIAEAMSAGAVPFVVPVGGPAEIVEDGATGFFWRSPEELVERTLHWLGRPDAERREVAERAAASVQRFSRARFGREIVALAETVLAG